MIKMIISDLDGTLLTIENKVHDEDILAIKEALNSGIDFCLASGRKDVDIQAVASIIGYQFHRISQNGAFIFSRENQQLHDSSFEPQFAKELLERFKADDVITILSTIDKEYVEEKDEYIYKMDERLFSPILEDKELHHKIGGTIIPSKIIIHGDEAKIHQLHKEITEAFPTKLDAYISEAEILDLVPKNISKGHAIELLLEHVGISRDEIACIGDSFNDIPMFQLTKNSYAMSTAHPDVKKEATHVVETVADAIHSILERNKIMSR